MFQAIRYAVLIFVTMGVMVTAGKNITRGPVDETQTDRTVLVNPNPDEGQTDLNVVVCSNPGEGHAD